MRKQASGLHLTNPSITGEVGYEQYRLAISILGILISETEHLCSDTPVRVMRVWEKVVPALASWPLVKDNHEIFSNLEFWRFRGSIAKANCSIRLHSDRKSMTILDRALEYAYDAHKGQKRQTGEEFVTHPIAVANAVMELTHNEDTIAAAYLHDVVEDCGKHHALLIRQEFGANISNMVDILTKDEDQEYFDYILKIHNASPAVKLIKRKDLEHNISTWPSKGSLRDKWKLALYVLGH